LIECAEEQAELLAENAAEVSDVMLLSPYEEVLRGCRLEMESLLDVPEFGSLDYELDRAVDRLICITTIIRNFSFAESNFSLLGMPFVVKFMSTIIRYLGTRNMLLRTYHNTLDFMKDAVIYLSNLSHTIHLPGKDEALCVLHFLLSFAPTPPPTSANPDGIMFTPYNPSVHRYMPAAVDSLAKLLARDDPNRTYYKAIFSSEGSSMPPNDLLTRTFGLSIAPIPEHMRGNIIAWQMPGNRFLCRGCSLLRSCPVLRTILWRALGLNLRMGSPSGFSDLLVCLVTIAHPKRPSGIVKHLGQLKLISMDIVRSQAGL